MRAVLMVVLGVALGLLSWAGQASAFDIQKAAWVPGSAEVVQTGYHGDRRGHDRRDYDRRRDGHFDRRHDRGYEPHRDWRRDWRNDYPRHHGRPYYPPRREYHPGPRFYGPSLFPLLPFIPFPGWGHPGGEVRVWW